MPYYFYSVTLINREKKPIMALVWNYVFRDPVTHNELKRLITVSPTKIGANQKNRSRSPEITRPFVHRRGALALKLRFFDCVK